MFDISKMEISSSKWILSSLGNLSFRDDIPPDSALSVKANFMQKANHNATDVPFYLASHFEAKRFHERNILWQ